MLQKKEVKIKKLSNVITQISLLGILCILVLCIWVMPAAAITWGDLDEDDLFPNVGMVGISVSGVPETICSGTLIAPSVVLTAGHCIDYVLMLEQFFDLYLSNALPGQGLPVTRYIIHTDYYWGPQSNPHDVGDLILEQPVDITPAELPELGFLDELKADGMLGKGRNKAKFTVVGYGATINWPPPVVDFNSAFQRRYAESEYRALLQAWIRLSQNHATNDEGSCFGDSGGPVFYTDSDGYEFLVGITSAGDPNCVSASFNYRTDILETLDFIEDVIDYVENNQQ
ncbi:MAG: S1 family peptidase [Planctomycetota bacterium]|jgi:secreted trypsin-like serine protease